MSQRRPNVIVILTDDQGYGDLSCMGSSDIRTPHLDFLAASGARLTHWYANAPVCSPTRASLLTGRYPGNAGVRSILRGHRTASGLPAEVPTLATMLRAGGYRTAMFGKWHLGLAPGSRPNDHGFDEFFGHLAGCIDYYSHLFYYDRNIDPLHDLWENGQEVYRNGQYMTDLITARAVDFIHAAAGAEQPFFLYVAYNAPHYPMHAPGRYVDRFKHLPPPRRIMAAMISAIDDGVGEILAELDRQGIAEDTLITFQSDNGPSRETRNWLDGSTTAYYGGQTGNGAMHFKGHKFSLYEGGIRVPGIIRYPARISAGQVIDTPGASMDIAPTVLSAAGIAATAGSLDGVDWMPHLVGGEPMKPRDLFFEQGKQTAIRSGRWKLVLNGQLVEGAPPEDAVHLADLDDDPGELNNLTAEQPDLTGELIERSERWHQGIENNWQRLQAAGAGAA